MAIAFDTSGVGGSTSALSSATVDITAAAVGAAVFVCIEIGALETSMTMTGWTQLESADTNSTSHHGIFWRIKLSGDTTFTVSWSATTAHHRWAWVSYTGCDVTPVESYASVVHSTSGSTAFATGSGTPTAATRWALCAYYVRSTTTIFDTDNWSAETVSGSAITERIESQQTTLSSPWPSVVWADSAAAVTAAAHSGAATLDRSEANGGGAIMFLIPSAGSTPIAVTDSGAGSDTATISATVPTSDAGSAADAAAVAATVPVSDTASGADAAAVVATVPLADSGSAADSISVNTGATPVALTDSGSASDALKATVTAPLADTASASDALTVVGTIHLADAATAADTVKVVAALALAEAAAALDSLSVVGTIHLADTAAGADSISVNTSGFINKALTDSGTASDSLCVETLRPDSGDTTRPSTGTTVYALATTARPGSGTTTRPNTGTTDPC